MLIYTIECFYTRRVGTGNMIKLEGPSTEKKVCVCGGIYQNLQFIE